MATKTRFIFEIVDAAGEYDLGWIDLPGSFKEARPEFVAYVAARQTVEGCHIKLERAHGVEG